MSPAVRSYLAEFVGTFTLVLVGTSVATLQGMLDMGPAGWLGICFAFGFTLLVLVLALGPVSGCHINPAVTLPMAVAGKLPWPRVPGYLVAQCLGAVAASGLLLALLSGLETEPLVYSLDDHGLGANGNPAGMSLAALLGWELVFTALFLMVIFAATRGDGMIPGTATPGFAALAIGGFLFVAHLVGAPLGDSSLNPARSLGPALFVGGDALAVLWVFVVGPVVGGLAGLGLYLLLYNDETPTGEKNG
ncbi:MAG: aquaporin [Planctomycetota bacterium]